MSPEGLAVGDFNEDGAPDVAINAGGRNYSSQYVSRTGEFLLLRNDGAGRLALAAEPLRLTSSGRIVAGDADGDGHLDALVGTEMGTARWVLRSPARCPQSGGCSPGRT